MQKLFWLREHGPRMVLPHTHIQRSHFCAMSSQRSDEGKHLESGENAPTAEKREKDTQHAVLRLVKGRFITMANEKILMVLMSVTDMAEAKAFYAEQLGWTVTSDYGQGDQHWVTLSLPGGGATLTLSTMHGKMKPGTMTLYLSTSDIEATYNDLKAKGVKVNEIKDDLYGPGSGVKWFNLHDPDENRWLVVQS
jgi:predicted enzyme related to lactoylglutathione lyase